MSNPDAKVRAILALRRHLESLHDGIEGLGPAEPKHVDKPSPSLGREKYPWSRTKVGGSFFVPEGETKIDSLRSAAGERRRRSNAVFKVKATEGGFTVTRHPDRPWNPKTLRFPESFAQSSG